MNERLRDSEAICKRVRGISEPFSIVATAALNAPEERRQQFIREFIEEQQKPKVEAAKAARAARLLNNEGVLK